MHFIEFRNSLSISQINLFPFRPIIYLFAFPFPLGYFADRPIPSLLPSSSMLLMYLLFDHSLFFSFQQAISLIKMSFTAPFDHSAFSPLQSDPSFYFAEHDRLSRRRRPYGDNRLHRCRRTEVGPNLCQRRLDPIHSFPNAANFIDTDGAPKLGQKELKRIVPALADNQLNLSNFGIPYSLNRRQRWILTDMNAAQLNSRKSQSNDLRVSIIYQKVNPLRKGTLNGRFERFWPGAIGHFGEDQVTKLSTFDAENEINRSAKSARGANSTKQLMQKGQPKTKKRQNRRTETAQREERHLLDLFESRDYSAVNPIPNVPLSDGYCPPPVHTYYTFRVQNTASRHQLNSGWQDKSMCRPLTKEELRQGGRWTKDWEGNSKWETLSRRQIGLCLQQNDLPSIVQKHRGTPCAKGDQRFALEADFEEYYQLRESDEEAVDENECEHEADQKATKELEEQIKRESTPTAPKALAIGDYLVARQKQKSNDANSKVKKVKRSDYVANGLIGPMDVLNEEDEIEETISPTPFSSAYLSEAEMHKGDELRELAPGEVGTIRANLEQAFVPLEDDVNGLLPFNTSIFQCRSDAKTVLSSNVFPPGSLLIIRKGISMDKYFMNPPAFSRPPTDQQHRWQQPLLANQSSAVSSNGGRSLIINSGSNRFLSDLLANVDTKKDNNWLIRNEPLFDDVEADAKAVQLLLEAENCTACQQQQQMPCCSSAAVVADPSSFSVPVFCGVCFAECRADDSFALRHCQPYRSHSFCDDCWRQHIIHCLSTRRVPITCMASDCPSVVRPSVALLVVGQSVVGQYHQMLASRRRMWRDFVTCGQCGGTVRLHSADWQNMLPLRHKAQQLTKCSHCDTTICCHCAQRQHLPLNCEQRVLYELILRSHGHSMQSLLSTEYIKRLASGIRCANCNNLVQKLSGCDHIICHCGYEFCWRCGGDWKKHQKCGGNGQINVPLFDLVFINGPNGRKLTKSPEKFFAECAEIRAFRHTESRHFYKLMTKIFTNDRLGARHWAEKFLQVSEFVELCLIKRLINGKKSDSFGMATDRLRFTFYSIPFIATKAKDEQMKLTISRQMVEECYGEIMMICKQIVTLIK